MIRAFCFEAVLKVFIALPFEYMLNYFLPDPEPDPEPELDPVVAHLVSQNSTCLLLVFPDASTQAETQAPKSPSPPPAITAASPIDSSRKDAADGIGIRRALLKSSIVHLQDGRRQPPHFDECILAPFGSCRL